MGRHPVHKLCFHPGSLVLGAASLYSSAPAEDRDRTVSRRSEPSSRTALNGEQPYPWDLLQPQDAMSRHRGAKPCRRGGLVGGLGCQSDEGGIPRATPRRLAPAVLGLPPILYTSDRQPMPSCSKGSRGLSVLPRVSRIFTTSAISPGPWSRQRPNRCAFRAGRNLPDKEFRYLRTVIVTAAVYRGLGSPLRARRR